MNLRRWFLLNALSDDLLFPGGNSGAYLWRGKQQAIAGTALQQDWPFRSQLVTAGYSTLDDLEEATAEELARTTPLNRAQIKAVLAALG